MRGLRRTEKFKTDKPSNLNRSESDGEPAKPKGRPGRTEAATARRAGRGRTEEQRAEYQNRKGRMETGATEGESREAQAERSTEGTTAGGDREEGKSGAES